jgi:hypothetical protein
MKKMLIVLVMMIMATCLFAGDFNYDINVTGTIISADTFKAQLETALDANFSDYDFRIEIYSGTDEVTIWIYGERTLEQGELNDSTITNWLYARMDDCGVSIRSDTVRYYQEE